MAEFLKLGRLRLNVDAIVSVTEETDGTVSVRETQTTTSFPADEGAVILGYTDGKLVGGAHEGHHAAAHKGKHA
jgi:hypothetical protein